MIQSTETQYGDVGFDHNYTLEIRRQAINANNPRSRKRQKQEKKQTMANTWRWTPKRREVAIKKATDCRLFDIKIDKGLRDRKMASIVSEINGMTDVDINFVLLTTEAFKREIYKTQRKVIKVPEEQMNLLPAHELVLRKQLKEAGEVEEATKTRLAGNTSLA